MIGTPDTIIEDTSKIEVKYYETTESTIIQHLVISFYFILVTGIF